MNNDLFECGKAICRLLGDAAADRPLSQAFPACADEAILFCESHRLQAMTAALVSTRPEAAATYQPLIDAGMRDVIKQMKNNAVEDALSRRFAEEGIRHTILKGSHTRSFYPSSLPRTSTDFDWQVSSDDVERAQALLLADGWSVKSVGDDERCYEKPPRSRLELHVACEGFNDVQQHAVQAMLDRAEEVAPSRYQFTDNDAYAYAVLHLYKHFLLAGAGVRMFLDVYTIEAHADLDRETVANTLDALGIAPFAARVRDINAVLFDGATSNNELDTLIRFIFSSLAYGVSSTQTSLELINTHLTHHSRTKRFLKNYCFDLTSMKRRYPCLRRAVVLYPFCAAHRIVNGLRFRRATLRDAYDKQQQGRAHADEMRHILELASII